MDVADHSFEDTVIAPTDDEEGYTTHTCVCGYTYNDNYCSKTYSVGFDGGDFAYAIGIMPEYYADDEVEFKVTVESGYEAFNVSASYTKDDAVVSIELEGSISEGFTFTMPKADVTIKAETRGAYFEIGPKDASMEVFKPEKAYAAKTVSDFIGGYIVDDKIYTGTTIYARAGAEVHLLRNYVASAGNIVYTVDGNELEESQYAITKTQGEGESAKEVTNTYNTIDFIMPAHSVEIGVTAEEKAFEVEVVAPEYVKWSTYVVASDGTKTEEANAVRGGMGTIYLSVSLKEDHQDGNYKINGVIAKYETREGYEDKEGYVYTKGTYDTQVTAGTLYKFSPTTYTNYYGKITLTVETLEAKYTNSSWVGTYGGKEFYGASSGSSCTASLTAFGETTGLNKKFTILEDDGNGKLSVNTDSTATAPSSYIYYDGDVLVANYYEKLENFTDVQILIRNKLNSEITWSTKGNMQDTNAIYIVAKDSSGEELGNFLKVEKEIYLNVQIEYDEGYNESSSLITSNFTVKKNGTELKHYEFATA